MSPLIPLFRWLSRCPLALLHAAGALAGWAAYLASPTYRHRFDAHVRQAGVSRAAARGAIAGAGRMLMELPLLWRQDSLERLAGRVRCSGLEAIAAGHAAGRGLILLTPHMGSFEVAAQAYAMHFGASHGPITVLYRPARKAWLRELVATARAKPGVVPAPATLAGVRQMMRALRRGETVGLLPDQVPPEGMGEWAPFFGRPAYTMTLAARLAQQSGAALLVCWAERLPRGRGYAVHYEPFGEALPAEASAQAESAAAVNRAMERLILRCPEQYLWGYQRYKAPRRTAPIAEDDNDT